MVHLQPSGLTYLDGVQQSFKDTEVPTGCDCNCCEKSHKLEQDLQKSTVSRDPYAVEHTVFTVVTVVRSLKKKRTTNDQKSLPNLEAGEVEGSSQKVKKEIEESEERRLR